MKTTDANEEALVKTALDCAYEGCSPNEAEERLVGMLRLARTPDDARSFVLRGLAVYKRYLLTKGLPDDDAFFRSLALLRGQLDLLEVYRNVLGTVVPRWQNLILSDAADRGIERTRILRAAVEAGVLKNGSPRNKNKNLCDRLSEVRGDLSDIQFSQEEELALASAGASLASSGDRSRPTMFVDHQEPIVAEFTGAVRREAHQRLATNTRLKLRRFGGRSEEARDLKRRRSSRLHSSVN